MREVVDAVLDVVGDVADLLHPVLGLLVVAAGDGEVAEEGLHAGELVVDELDVAADSADERVLLCEEAAQLAQEGLEGGRRRANRQLHASATGICRRNGRGRGKLASTGRRPYPTRGKGGHRRQVAIWSVAGR